MPRGNKPAAEDDLLKDLPAAEEDAGGGNGHDEGGGAAEVAVRGKGRTVADALRKAGLKGQAKDLKGKFNDLLKNPTNKIVASRIFPRQLRGPDGKMRECADVVELPPPMSLDEITMHLREEYGGKKWNITVSDEDGEVLDRRNIDVPGEARYVHTAMDDFAVPSLEDFAGGGEQEEPEEDPMDREIEQAQKQSRLLLVERQNASLRAQLAEARGESAKKNGEKTTEQIVAEALAAQEAKHKAELAERDSREKMQTMESRITDATSRQINDLKGLIEKMQQGNPQQSTALSDLGHKLELLQTTFDSKIKDALQSYREMTNTQIAALDKAVDAKLNGIITSINNLQNRPHEENPMKAMIPLITSSIERSTAGYKDMMGPLINHMTAKQEADTAPAANPLEETLETLGKFNLLGDRKSGDFGSRVVDFAEKMAPEILSFVREEKRAGREVTEAAIKNHMKLQAEKISREVSAAAAQEIKKIRQEGQHALPAPKPPAPPASTVSHQGRQGPSPVGNMSPEEVAARQRQERQVAPAPAPAPVAPPPPVQKVQEPVEEPGEEEEEEEELTVEEEMAARVNSVLSILEREMKVRPRQITWPNAAWDDLPGEVLDQIIFANDEEDVYKAIEPHADKELSDRIWQLVRTDSVKKEFIVAGINQIKEWAVELQRKKAAAEAPAEAPPAPEGGGA